MPSHTVDWGSSEKPIHYIRIVVLEFIRVVDSQVISAFHERGMHDEFSE